MSKLAHSDEKNMTLIDVRRAVDGGNEDCVGLTRVQKPACEICGQNASFLSAPSDNRYYCRQHAEEWACKYQEST